MTVAPIKSIVITARSVASYTIYKIPDNLSLMPVLLNTAMHAHMQTYTRSVYNYLTEASYA